MKQEIAFALCRRLVGAACLTTLCLSSANGQEEAQPPNDGRTYLEARLGFPLPDAVDMDIVNSAGPAQSGQQDHFFRTAYVLAFMVGHYFTEDFHTELEFSHVRLSNAKVKFDSGFAGNPFAGATQAGTGTVRSYGLSANLLYDLPLDLWGAKPFIGIGGGGSYVHTSGLGVKAGAFRMTDSDLVYMGCLLAGVHYRIRDNLDMTVRYTGVISSASHFNDFSNGQAIAASVDAGFNHGLSVGFRIFLD